MDFDSTFEFLGQEINQGDDPFPVQMQRYLSLCAKDRPHKGWAPLKKFDWAAELERLTNWLTRLLKEEPVSPPANGIYFGLFNLARSNREVTYELYVAGYPADPKNPEWCVGPGLWWPEGRYANCQALSLLYQVTHDPKSDLEDAVIADAGTGFLTLVGTALACEVDTELWLRKEKQRIFAAGWDEGEAYQLGTLARDGFDPDFQGLG